MSVGSLEPKPSLEPKVMQETSSAGNRTWPSAGYIVTVTFRKPSPSAFTPHQTTYERTRQEHRAKIACWSTLGKQWKGGGVRGKNLVPLPLPLLLAFSPYNGRYRDWYVSLNGQLYNIVTCCCFLPLSLIAMDMKRQNSQKRHAAPWRTFHVCMCCGAFWYGLSRIRLLRPLKWNFLSSTLSLYFTVDDVF